MPELVALKNKHYPRFVFDRNPKTLKDEIPVFTLHSVIPGQFEEELQHLYSNGYQALTSDAFYECITVRKPVPERAVLLAFDDGWRNLRSVGYPLLKKYGFQAVCFLIAGVIRESDAQSQSADQQEAPDRLCSWSDVREMHDSGVIDFQSHSMYHNLVFISSTVEDFIHPSFDTFTENLNVPSFMINGQDNLSRHAPLGTPIYECAPRFAGKRRYFDDEKLRRMCVEFVEFKGGLRFFRNYNWRKQLMRVFEQHREREGDSGYYESDQEVREALYQDLVASKGLIEEKLPGKEVKHFCYPWWQGCDLAIEVSKEAGYLTNFWGILPGRRTNRCGDDPCRIVRLLSDDYIFRLPGSGRKSLLKIIENRFRQHYKGFTNKLMEPD